MEQLGGSPTRTPAKLFRQFRTTSGSWSSPPQSTSIVSEKSKPPPIVPSVTSWSLVVVRSPSPSKRRYEKGSV